MKLILYLIVAVLVISMLRSVIGIIAKTFGDIINPPAPSSGGPRRSVPTGGELKKDPVCGTFISTATALQKKVGGEVYYFCSEECRGRFRG